MAEDVGNAGMEQMIPLINKLQVQLIDCIFYL